jgi:hypothetical protein
VRVDHVEIVMNLRTVALAVLALGAFAAPLAFAADTAPVVAVSCKDGTTSKAGHGACSHHGGVDPNGPAAVMCKDGTTSKAGQGACSHHGGVAPPHA